MKTIRGHQRAVQTLCEQHAADRLHHAYIFHGPAGVGKFTAARAFARMLLNTESNEHPDLHIVTKELARYSDDANIRSRKLMSIPVAVVRQALLEPVYRAANVPGGRKVFIVDEAELLNRESQNALLKTLEEPPAGTVLILVTAGEDRLLPTIRSRAQRVAFHRLPDAVVADWLSEHAADLSDDRRDAALTFAQGSIGRAQLALDYDLLPWVERVLPAIDALSHGKPDAALGADIHRFVDDFAKTWVDRHDNASKEAANQHGASLMYSMIADHAARRLREAADSDDPEASTEPWLAVIDAIEQSRQLLASNLNPSLVADHLAAQIAGCFEPASA